MADEITTFGEVSPQFPIATKRVPIVSDLHHLEQKTTAVAGSATYTGSFFAVKKFKQIVGTVEFNENGTLYFDFSSDGATADWSDTLATVGGTADSFAVEIVAPFFRVRWANGTANATTTHRLFVYGKTL